tara:strand:+ start:1168 stop:1557 length:390 start_codon:yes stop_codon:yes gene_type:complete
MLLSSPQEYLYQLKTKNKAEATRMWRQAIKDKWRHRCAYCGIEHSDMTIDHVIPQCLGGTNELTNVICSCERCNHSKNHDNFETWYIQQPFYSKQRHRDITEWCRIKYEGKKKRYIRGRDGKPTRTMIL